MMESRNILNACHYFNIFNILFVKYIKYSEEFKLFTTISYFVWTSLKNFPDESDDADHISR